MLLNGPWRAVHHRCGFQVSAFLVTSSPTGGSTNNGTVFKIDSSGNHTVLYSFKGIPGGGDGSRPEAGVTLDAAGNLYGTTYLGGAGFTGLGTVYEVDANGNETVLHAFTGGADGAFPSGGVIRDEAGNLYGTAVGGGADGFGVVFMVDAEGNETPLYAFTGVADGGYPMGWRDSRFARKPLRSRH